VVDNNPTNYDNIFTGTTKDIYVVNNGHANVITWRDIIVANYRNSIEKIHYEGRSNTPPNIVSLNVNRGKLTINETYVLTSDTFNENKTYYEKTREEWSWFSSDTENWIRVQVSTYLSKEFLPINWTNQYVRDFFVIFRDEPTQFYIDPQHTSYIKIPNVQETNRVLSKTIQSGVQYYGLIDNIYYREVDTTSLADDSIGYMLSYNLTVINNKNYYTYNSSTHAYELVNTVGN
jgi:hypothetical protein